MPSLSLVLALDLNCNAAGQLTMLDVLPTSPPPGVCARLTRGIPPSSYLLDSHSGYYPTMPPMSRTCWYFRMVTGGGNARCGNRVDCRPDIKESRIDTDVHRQIEAGMTHGGHGRSGAHTNGGEVGSEGVAEGV